jgi:hypothetical protein
MINYNEQISVRQKLEILQFEGAFIYFATCHKSFIHVASSEISSLEMQKNTLAFEHAVRNYMRQSLYFVKFSGETFRHFDLVFL